MLLVSAVDIALGWAWHTAYMARRRWSLRREGALIAAAFVTCFGIIDTIRTSHAAKSAPAEAVGTITASATPSLTAVTPEVVQPASTTPDTLPAIASPTLVDATAQIDDPIGNKITTEKLYTDPISTGSIPEKPKKTRSIKANAPSLTQRNKTAGGTTN